MSHGRPQEAYALGWDGVPFAMEDGSVPLVALTSPPPSPPPSSPPVPPTPPPSSPPVPPTSQASPVGGTKRPLLAYLSPQLRRARSCAVASRGVAPLVATPPRTPPLSRHLSLHHVPRWPLLYAADRASVAAAGRLPRASPSRGLLGRRDKVARARVGRWMRSGLGGGVGRGS